MLRAATRRRLLQQAAGAAAAAAEGNATAASAGSAPPAGAAAAAGAVPAAPHGRPGNASDAVRNVIDDGEDDLAEDFTDMETVVLTCITTLVTLVFAFIAGFCVRFLWRKLRERSTAPGYEGVLQREESSDPLAVKSLSASGNLLTDEVRLEDSGAATKTTTTKFSASASPHQNGVFVVEVQQGSVAPPAGGGYAASSALYSGTPGAGAAAAGGAGAAGAPGGPSGAGGAGGSQCAQVHRPPEIEIDDVDDIADIDDVDDDEDEEDEQERAGAQAAGGRFGSTNTGLSQSDLSMSSAGSNNPSYRYGNQVGYDSGHFGYPQYSGYSVSDESAPLAALSPDEPVALATAPRAPALSQQRGNSVDQTLAYGPLMSDSQAVQRRKEEADEDVHQEEQRKLGNGSVKAEAEAAAAAAAAAGAGAAATPNGDAADAPGLQRKGSLPPRLAAKDDKDGAEADDKAERLNTVAELPACPADADKKDAAARGKRASLPIITPDLYKQTKNLILDKTNKPRSSLSPKFERLRNEVSPLEEGDKCPQNDTEGGEGAGAGGGGGGGADAGGGEGRAGPGAEGAGASQYENQAFVAADQAAS